MNLLLINHSIDAGMQKTIIISKSRYITSHESHYRGNMLLTLKQAGEKIPDKIKWELWEWGK